MDLRRSMRDEKQGVGSYLINRKRRRTLGIVLLVLIGALMMGGAYLFDFSNHPMHLLVYWGSVLLLLLVVIYLALLDVLFIRYQYAAKSRDIFRSTFGESTKRNVSDSTKENALDMDEQ